MRLPSAPTKQVVDHLNGIYFQQVWNAPRENGRANVQLYKVATRAKSGVVPVGRTVVGLPTTDTVYAVYQTGYRAFNQFIKLPDDQWVEAKSYLAVDEVAITIYDVNGKTVPISDVYIRYISNKDKVLVAVPSLYTKKCVGSLYPDLYLTVFRDLTRATPSREEFYIAGSVLNGSTSVTTIQTAIVNAQATFPNGTFVSVNGWVYHPDHVPTIVTGDLVTIVSDPDIVGHIDVTVDDNTTGYYSTKYEEYREILHVPKSLNPNNILINTDNLTVIVFDTLTNKGVLGHRIAQHAVESITHNDFSMGRTAIQGFTQSLSALTVTVRVYVRLPVDTNRLNEDVNRIKDLYSLNDAAIMNQLLGLASPQIPEWSAWNLEQSPFLSMIASDKRQELNEAIPSFVDAMGYYDVASVLGQQMRFYTYKNSQVKIIKPVRLFGYRCQAMVYADGIKVPESGYTITDYDSKTFLLGFLLGSGVGSGARIAVYICEEGFRTPTPFVPTEESPSITFDSEDHSVYMVKTYTDPQPVWESSVTKGYSHLPKGDADYIVTTNVNGTSTFTFRMKHFGKAFYCVPKYGLTTAVYDISDSINADNPIVVSLSVRDVFGEFLPIVGYTTAEVYLNGKKLIEDLDYVINYVYHADGYILQNLLTVTNCDYLDLEGGSNIVEVCVHGDEIVSEDKGYGIENNLYRSSVPMIFSRSSSRTYVRGVLTEHVSESGNIATIVGDVDNGAPFLMQHMVAFGARKLLRDISPNQDINLRSRIEHVLGFVEPDVDDFTIVTHLHALYSVFLAKIVTDVANGVLHIRDEPSDSNFLRQFKPYALLLERDPVIGQNNVLIDRRFVTLASHYVNLGVNNPDQMLRIQRLTSMTLQPSELSINEVLL
jgi:hypothetical protein